MGFGNLLSLGGWTQGIMGYTSPIGQGGRALHSELTALNGRE